MVLLFTFFAVILFGTTTIITDLLVHADDSYDPNYPYTFFNEELIQKNTRANFTLKCSKNCLKSNLQFRWEFQPCGREFDKPQCSELLENITKKYCPERESNWKRVEANGRCALDIKGATQGMSGLYRCLEQDSIIMVYTVEIINGESSKMLRSMPKIREIIPYNKTVMRDTQINIQCKVVCDIPPEIRWFKLVEDQGPDAVYHEGNWYIHVNASSSENDLRFQGVDVYVSKLKILKAREADSGLYICLAMTGSGSDYKAVQVHVDGLRDADEMRTSFPVLFLIPLCLALVPIIVWLCYFKRRLKHGGRGRKTVVAANAAVVNGTRGAVLALGMGGNATATVAPPSSINGSCCRNGAGTARPYKYTNVVQQNGVIDRDFSSSAASRMDSFEFKV